MAHIRVHNSASPISEEKNLAECCCCFFENVVFFAQETGCCEDLSCFLPNILLETPLFLVVR